MHSIVAYAPNCDLDVPVSTRFALRIRHEDKMKRGLPLIVSMILLAGCGKPLPPKFAQGSNPRRKEIGLPVIGEDWVNYNRGNNRSEAAWNTPGSNHASPNHAGKKVIYSSGQWQYEEDCYYSGKTGPSPDPDGGTQWEKVTVSYAFVPYNNCPTGWTCRYQSPTDWGEKITLKEAESILESWGVKRLNY